MNIILIGYMGAGKSSVGRRLAGKRQVPFFDTDDEIEEWERRKIADIFAAEGEEYFRSLETRILQRFLEEKKHAVIAVGGGLPLREENRRLMKELGICIYLKVSKETILERLKHDTKRPLLREADKEQRVEHMLREREPVYESAADITVITDRREFEQIMDEIEMEMGVFLHG